MFTPGQLQRARRNALSLVSTSALVVNWRSRWFYMGPLRVAMPCWWVLTRTKQPSIPFRKQLRISVPRALTDVLSPVPFVTVAVVASSVVICLKSLLSTLSTGHPIIKLICYGPSIFKYELRSFLQLDSGIDTTFLCSVCVPPHLEWTERIKTENEQSIFQHLSTTILTVCCRSQLLFAEKCTNQWECITPGAL